jgi:hypothetical protein
LKPNFFVIGASKSGTSSLCELLDNHPDVFFTTPKEPSYFSDGEDHGLTLDWYQSLFQGAEGHRAVGEGSTNYAVVGLHPGVAEKLEAYAPGSRVIYIVRHPPERIESQWIQLRTGNQAPNDFVRAVREVPEMIEGNLYWKNISSFRGVFPDDRILVLFFDDFKADARAVVRRCFRFLDLDPDVPLQAPQRPRNVRQSKRQDKPVLRLLRRLPGFQRLRDALVPGSVRPRLRQITTSPIPDRPEWDEPTYQWVVDRIREDNLRFLRFYGKPEDFWSYDLAWLERRNVKKSSNDRDQLTPVG